MSWAVVYCNTELHVYNVLVSVEDTNTTNNYSPQNDLKLTVTVLRLLYLQLKNNNTMLFYVGIILCNFIV